MKTTFPSQCRPGPILAHRVGEWLSHSSLNLDSLPGSGAGVGWFAGFNWHTRFDVWLLALAVVCCNLPLVFGRCAAALIFLPAAVAGGEWWRLFTHPFVHVSWYHLLLDAGAFFSLYTMPAARGPWRRLTVFGACAAGSLVVSVLACPAVAAQGLCGLSGVGHGLLAVVAVDLLRDPGQREIHWLGLAALLILLGKCVFEAWTGGVCLSFLHLGNVGYPVAVCHAGGMLGGLLLQLLRR